MLGVLIASYHQVIDAHSKQSMNYISLELDWILFDDLETLSSQQSLEL